MTTLSSSNSCENGDDSYGLNSHSSFQSFAVSSKSRRTFDSGFISTTSSSSFSIQPQQPSMPILKTERSLSHSSALSAIDKLMLDIQVTRMNINKEGGSAVEVDERELGNQLQHQRQWGPESSAVSAAPATEFMFPTTPLSNSPPALSRPGTTTPSTPQEMHNPSSSVTLAHLLPAITLSGTLSKLIIIRKNFSEQDPQQEGPPPPTWTSYHCGIVTSTAHLFGFNSAQPHEPVRISFDLAVQGCMAKLVPPNEMLDVPRDPRTWLIELRSPIPNLPRKVKVWVLAAESFLVAQQWFEAITQIIIARAAQPDIGFVADILAMSSLSKNGQITGPGVAIANRSSSLSSAKSFNQGNYYANHSSNRSYQPPPPNFPPPPIPIPHHPSQSINNSNTRPLQNWTVLTPPPHSPPTIVPPQHQQPYSPPPMGFQNAVMSPVSPSFGDRPPSGIPRLQRAPSTDIFNPNHLPPSSSSNKTFSIASPAPPQPGNYFIPPQQPLQSYQAQDGNNGSTNTYHRQHVAALNQTRGSSPSPSLSSLNITNNYNNFNSPTTAVPSNAYQQRGRKASKETLAAQRSKSTSSATTNSRDTSKHSRVIGIRDNIFEQMGSENKLKERKELAKSKGTKNAFLTQTKGGSRPPAMDCDFDLL